MGEFPVLQMMYRQGMIIPNHPGNTGRKPLLIGSPKQLRCQMEYIFRGNYGLVSEAEMVEAGVTPEEAKLMMALKLKFAFGKIRPSEELLDSISIESEPVEIVEGLWLERLQSNVYKFKHGEDEVTVDMKLHSDQNYAIPYALHHHKIKRDYFSVIHSGEGDGWDIHRPSMSSIMMFQGKVYLIDAGPNIHHILNHLGIGINEIDGIFHTHSHDDHFAGLTTLMRTDKKVKYFSTSLVRSCVIKKLCSLLDMQEQEFSHYFEPVDLAFDEWNYIDGLEIRPIFSPHPVETSIFEFRTLWEDGYLSYAHLADITARKVLDGMVDSDSGINADWVNHVYDHYLRQHTLKKLDIGGGMIHGDALDFCDDSSEKIILSHTSKELTVTQKSIGSGSPFGTVDVLIKSQWDILRSQANAFLRSYFPKISENEMNLLMNFSLVSFNPESIMMKGGEANRDIYLVLTGNVDMIEAESGMHTTLSSGAILGEFSGMVGVSLEETYRAQSFVTALRLPGQLYYEFVKRNNFYHEIEEMADKRWFLQRTWLFGESISTTIQNTIARDMEELEVERGNFDFGLCKDSLLLLLEGKVRLSIGERELRSLGQGDVLGEDVCFFNSPPLCNAFAETKVVFYRVSREAIENIPIVRFKMRGLYESKMNFFMEEPWLRRKDVFMNTDGLSHHDMHLHQRKLRDSCLRYVDMVTSGCKEALLDMSLGCIIEQAQELHRVEGSFYASTELSGWDARSEEHQAFLETLRGFYDDCPFDDREGGIQTFVTLLIEPMKAVISAAKKIS
jgi:hemerythrin